MNEINYLKHLISLEQQAQDLKLKIAFPENPQEKSKLKKELDVSNQNIKQAKIESSRIEDKKYSQEAQKIMLLQLKAYVNRMSNAKNWLKLSRNQGLILDNYLFSAILRDLQYLVTDEAQGFHDPAHLLFTYSPEDSVEIEELRQHLMNEINILRNIKETNYNKLREFYSSFKIRIITRFIEQNVNTNH